VTESNAVDVAALLDRFQRAAATIAVAESLTGGLVTARLTDVAGASATVRGGLVVYATDLKATLADVPRRLLAKRGPVDGDVALALARGVRARLRATVGLGVTGVAGPDAQDGVAVGTVFLAVSGPEGETLAERQFHGGRAEIREQAVAVALRLLERESLDLVER
jgi:nicotinamide-nucleotide amidase